MKWRFAFKYLLAKKSHSVINIIALVSLLSVVVPVMAMVILLSVFNGFESLVRDLYKVVDADIEITPSTGVFDMSDEQLRSEILDTDGVEACSFIIERQALLRYRDNYTTALVRGVDSCYHDVVPILGYVSLGNATVELGDIDRVLVGEGIAHALGIYAVGINDVQIVSLGGARIGSILPTQGVRNESLPLCGTFIIDQQHDSSMAVTSIRVLDRLFDCRGCADAVFVKVKEGVSHRKVGNALAERLDSKAKVVLREDKNSSFYAIMRYEKWGVFLISLLVLIVASFSIIGTVVMLIVEKSDERPTLYSLGADRAFLRGVFLREGLLISGIGGVVGLTCGVVIVLLQERYGIVKMPNGNFLIENYPVELQLGDLMVIFVAFMAVAVVVSTVATRTMIKRE